MRPPLHPSRIKEAVDHAGPSPPPVPLRVLTSLPVATWGATLRCNSLTATTVSPRTWAATVVLWTRLSLMLRRPPSPLRKLTHMLPRRANATSPSSRVPPLRSQLSLMSRRTTQMHSRPSSTRVQSLSLSRLTSWSSRPTNLVSSPVTSAEPTLTTVSSLSDMALTLTELSTTSSRTPGTQHGETRDTSTLELKMVQVSAVSRVDHHPNQLLTELENLF